MCLDDVKPSLQMRVATIKKQLPAGHPASQLFAPGADAVLRLVLWGGVLAVMVAAVVAFGLARSSYAGGVGVAPEQPVPFSHKHHSGELGLDCRNCHQQVEQYASAGLPPTHTCMTCHSQIWTGSEMLQPVRDSYTGDQPLQWVRVNRLPDYTYYNHSIHITKGIGCSSCHGAVDTMQLTYRANSFNMEFCLSCHRAPEKYVRTPDQVWNMEWVAPPNQDVLGPELVKQYHIRAPEQLIDCSTCHR